MFQFNDEVEEETLDTPEVEEVEEVEEIEDTEEEDVDTLKARLAKAEELANNYKIRAEKAEKKPKEQKSVSTNGLSTADIIALTRANISDEDIDEVVEYASLKKMSVSEALKSDIVQATIKIREEKRTSAQAVHTGVTRRANNGTSDERLLDNARAGKMPENEADMARLAELRLKNRKR